MVLRVCFDRAPCIGIVRRSGMLRRGAQSIRCDVSRIERDRQPRRQQVSVNSNGRLPVLTLVASAVQINSDLAWFEQVAGRTAMIAFTVALCLEPALPDGIFSSWTANGLATYLGATSLLVSSAAVLATQNHRSFGGLKIQKAALCCITAFTRLASSNLQKSVDHALDIVFEQVFGSQFIDANFLDLDDLMG